MDGYNKQAIINNNGKTCINTLSEQFQNHIDNHGNKAKSMPLAHIYIQNVRDRSLSWLGTTLQWKVAGFK